MLVNKSLHHQVVGLKSSASVTFSLVEYWGKKTHLKIGVHSLIIQRHVGVLLLIHVSDSL